MLSGFPTRSSVLFDRRGQPIDALRFGELMQDPAERNIAFHMITERGGSATALFVSTVWVGADMDPFSPVPVIFETMVRTPAADGGPPDIVRQVRYPTEDMARAGHYVVVAETAAELAEPIIAAVLDDTAGAR